MNVGGKPGKCGSLKPNEDNASRKWEEYIVPSVADQTNNVRVLGDFDMTTLSAIVKGEETLTEIDSGEKWRSGIVLKKKGKGAGQCSI